MSADRRTSRPPERGAAAVEFALILPLLLLILAGVIDLGRLYFTQVMLTNAAREGARMVAMGYSESDATKKVVAASPGLTELPYSLAAVYTTCPNTDDVGKVTLTLSGFDWLILDGAMGVLGGGPPSLTNPTATASMRCMG